MKSKSFFYLFAVAAFCVVTAGCEKPKLSENQEILFECYYLNYASGYQHSGSIIDKNGNIKIYSQESPYYNTTEGWNFPDDNGFISEESMKENLEKTDLSDKKIDLETLQKYAAKILSVKYDDYFVEQTMCDFGAIVNVCYLFNDKTKMYKQILLSENGDWAKINNHSVAKEIDDWLNTAIWNKVAK